MSNSKKDRKNPPPDDYAKTTPNINLDQDELDGSSSDWNNSFDSSPSDAPADDWGKTVINYDVSDHTTEEDFGSQQHPSKEKPAEPDWGLTQANVNVDDEFADESEDDSSRGVTVPYFKLPEAERAKYQNLPPTPTERVKKEEERKRREGGVPTWFWVSAGLMTMFSFAVLVLLGAWFLLSGQSGFTVKVKGAQPFSEVFVDGSRWGLTTPEGTIDLVGLRADRTRTIIIRKKDYLDDVREEKGFDGEVKEIIARQIKAAPECEKIDLTNIKEREDCARRILAKLDNPPNLKDLLRALNLYYINFASRQHRIPASRHGFLEEASIRLKSLPPGVVIEVGGHTDNVGSDSNNQSLSERRANSVKVFFVSKGVSDSRLTTRGYGESRPKENNSTQGGRFQNRRIEYSVK